MPASHPLSKVHICDLGQTCGSQSEHFHQLSKDLLNFRLQSHSVEILLSKATSESSNFLSEEEQLPKVAIGFETQTEAGRSHLGLISVKEMKRKTIQYTKAVKMFHLKAVHRNNKGYFDMLHLSFIYRINPVRHLSQAKIDNDILYSFHIKCVKKRSRTVVTKGMFQIQTSSFPHSPSQPSWCCLWKITTGQDYWHRL